MESAINIFQDRIKNRDFDAFDKLSIGVVKFNYGVRMFSDRYLNLDMDQTKMN